VQQPVYQTKVRDFDELKQRPWDGLEQCIIDDSIDEWFGTSE